MKKMAFCAPIVSGKSDDARRVGKEIMGPRHKEMTESRSGLQQTRETVWIQPSQMGDILVVYLEGQDSVRANREFAASTSPFDRWFKEQAGAINGVDYNQPLPEGSIEDLLEWADPGPTKGKKSLAIAVPVAAGKTADLKRWAQEISGPRAGDQMDFYRRAGVTMAGVWLQHTPMGDFAIQYSEGDDPARAYQSFAASSHPFDKWNREQLGAIHGVDFSQPFPAFPELVFDWQAG